LSEETDHRSGIGRNKHGGKEEEEKKKKNKAGDTSDFWKRGEHNSGRVGSVGEYVEGRRRRKNWKKKKKTRCALSVSEDGPTRDEE